MSYALWIFSLFQIIDPVDLNSQVFQDIFKEYQVVEFNSPLASDVGSPGIPGGLPWLSPRSPQMEMQGLHKWLNVKDGQSLLTWHCGSNCSPCNAFTAITINNFVYQTEATSSSPVPLKITAVKRKNVVAVITDTCAVTQNVCSAYILHWLQSTYSPIGCHQYLHHSLVSHVLPSTLVAIKFITNHGAVLYKLNRLRQNDGIKQGLTLPVITRWFTQLLLLDDGLERWDFHSILGRFGVVDNSVEGYNSKDWCAGIKYDRSFLSFAHEPLAALLLMQLLLETSTLLKSTTLLKTASLTTTAFLDTTTANSMEIPSKWSSTSSLVSTALVPMPTAVSIETTMSTPAPPQPTLKPLRATQPPTTQSLSATLMSIYGLGAETVVSLPVLLLHFSLVELTRLLILKILTLKWSTISPLVMLFITPSAIHPAVSFHAITSIQLIHQF
ncbi:hypothetical protein BDR26DRAFT_935818 [Obelidium mucronatum]|nr:hypothetical protein BDR26DRAFT_935818 [Obelidium mucronatum]